MKHGMRYSRTYKTWRSMLDRCYLPSYSTYPRYGGKGVTVCEEWRYSFVAFYRDMGSRPENKTIDRIDNTKGYTKDNCKWSTYTQQNANRTIAKLSIDGVRIMRSMCASGALQKEVAEYFGVSKQMVSFIIRGDSWKEDAVC